MAAGQAVRRSLETGKKVCIVGDDGSPRWSEVWDGNPHITPTLNGAEIVKNGPRCRPYIRYPFTSKGHEYTGWRARDNRPRLYLSASERLALDAAFVLIEPTVKPSANVNKRWHRWQEVVSLLPDVRFVHCGPERLGTLRAVEWVQTPTFRAACGLLAGASAYLGSEGGMHHAAAALNVPAVVLFGGSCSVEATGYPDHINFGGTDPCGRWAPCEHCRKAMEAITPEMVAQALRGVLNG